MTKQDLIDRMKQVKELLEEVQPEDDDWSQGFLDKVEQLINDTLIEYKLDKAEERLNRE